MTWIRRPMVANSLSMVIESAVAGIPAADDELCRRAWQIARDVNPVAYGTEELIVLYRALAVVTAQEMGMHSAANMRREIHRELHRRVDTDIVALIWAESTTTLPTEFTINGEDPHHDV
jgi:hypothetical protein